MSLPDSYRPRHSDISRIRSVLGRPQYLAVGITVASLSFVVYAIVLNVSLLVTLVSEGSYGLAVGLIPGLVRTHLMMTPTVGIVMSVLISLIIGINFALVAFRLGEMASFGFESASSLGGMAVAVVAPACPACATTVFAFAGATSFFALLPFKGTEIKVLALLLLGTSMVWIARQIDKDTCRV